MRRPRLLIVFVAAVVAAFAIGGPVGQLDHLHHAASDALGPARALAQAVGFVFTFDGAPSAPQAWQPADWDVMVHNDGGPARPYQARVVDHGGSCSAPPAAHPVAVHAGAVFVCNDHVMTAAEEEYGAIYLTPNRLVDFSAGEAVIRFDLSTMLRSAREWMSVTVTPYEENMALPGTTAMLGPPRRRVEIFSHLDTFRATVARNFVEENVPFQTELGWGQFLVPSASRRDPVEIRLSRTRLRVGLPSYNVWYYDRPIADLGWSRGVVQFGHLTYSANKGCLVHNPGTGHWDAVDPGPPDGCENTWHWDNVRIEPAVPFTIVRATKRLADANDPVVTLAAPAPANAHLRFGGTGLALELSLDGGTSSAAGPPAALTRL